uniref:Uncharacterized protein n=1 Tax=Caenorhabditis japonica TaxID=281687 RepID=A0A8R1I2W8_CAEJA
MAWVQPQIRSARIRSGTNPTLRPNPKPPEFEVVRMRGAQIRNARVRSGTNPKWYGSEAPKLETPESEVVRIKSA